MTSWDIFEANTTRSPLFVHFVPFVAIDSDWYHKRTAPLQHFLYGIQTDGIDAETLRILIELENIVVPQNLEFQSGLNEIPIEY